MEEQISAFAVYNSIKKAKKTKSSSPKNKKSKSEDLVKQALIQQILDQQFNKKKNKKKKKNKSDVTKDFESPDMKKKHISTSTPYVQQMVNQITKKIKISENDQIKEESESGNSLIAEVSMCENGQQENDEISEPSLSSPSNEDSQQSPIKLKKNSICSTDKVQNNTKNEYKSNETSHSSETTTEIISNSIISSVKNSKLNALKNNSITDGQTIFKWLINPIEIDVFFKKFWENAPCLIKHKNNYYSKLLSFEMIDKMLLENHVEFTKNIDITKYENGIRETLNPEGRALPGDVWEKYAAGCSIRLLNPQTFLPSIFSMNTTLQEYFHCMVGANVYLTPPNSQGFAPHYDDIEAFVLQIEGKKQWKLYNPRSKNEELPRFSSTNFQQNEIGKPIFKETLEPGNVLYFPRGTIHQASTVPGCHSLHITLSFYQKQSYADLCEKLFPLILQNAIKEDLEMRRGLPLHIWNNMGIVHSDTQSNERRQVFKHISNCIKRAIAEIPIDDAVDQLAKKFQHEALPPEIKSIEKPHTIFGLKNFLNENGEVISNMELTLENKIRLLRAHILRLVREEGLFRIYFYIDNSKEYQEYEPNFIEIESEDAAAIDVLVKSYPDYIYIKDLPLDDDERKLEVCQALWERGLIMLKDSF